MHFAYRVNSDGSLDSICLCCFQTVGVEATREHLSAHEQVHRCDPFWTGTGAPVHGRQASE